MKSNFFNNIQFALLFVCAFAGAGFASGAEICVFFSNFNILGIILTFFCCCFLCFCIIAAFNKTNNFDNKFFIIIQTIMFVVICSAMISGLNSISKTLTNNPLLIVTMFMLLAIILLNKHFSKWTIYCELFSILTIFVIAVCCFLSPTCPPSNFEFLNIKSNFAMPFLYVCFNFFTILPFTKTTKTFIKTKQSRWFIAILSSLIIFVLIVLMSSKISNNTTQMPMLSLSKNISTRFYFIYIFILFICIFTTIVSCLHGLENISSKQIKHKPTRIVFWICVCFFVSSFGFDTIVQKLYPLLGVLGMIFLVCLFFSTNSNQIILHKKRDD